MNDENEEFTRRNKEKMERWKESHGRPEPPEDANGWSRLVTPSQT
jgi:hypothetical protein